MSLVELLPERLRDTQIGDFEDALAAAYDAMDNLRSLAEQAAPGTATWGLGYWEAIYGITPLDGQTVVERREVVIAKMRTASVTTADIIDAIAESFDNGEVEVHEYPAEYRVVIEFVSTLGIPKNEAALLAAVASVMPAHLAVEYLYKYRLWRDATDMSWGQVAGQSWGKFIGVT